MPSCSPQRAVYLPYVGARWCPHMLAQLCASACDALPFEHRFFQSMSRHDTADEITVDPVVMTFCSNESLILVEFLSYPGELCYCMHLVAQVLCSCLIFLAFICLLLSAVFLIVSVSVTVPALVSANGMFVHLVFALAFL